VVLGEARDEILGVIGEVRDIVVIGAGQAGLSSAYHLKKRGLVPDQGFVVLDQAPQPGGAWQFRWPSL
jgi:cation diffusion facilitator CzcD-associated flavoprotein CzcO